VYFIKICRRALNAQFIGEIMKKNRLIGGALGIVLCLMLEACVTHKPIFIDTNIPEEQCATVYFNQNIIAGMFTPTSFNGIPLEVKTVMGTTFLKDGTYLILPVNKATTITGDMLCTMYYGNKKSVFKAKGMEFAYIFEAGKTYYVEAFVKSTFDDGFFGDKLTIEASGVRIFDGVKFGPQNYATGNEDKLLAFIPFKVQPEYE
jgi:hypothetical protein